MIVAILLVPALTVLPSAALVHVVWWLVGDFPLEHVGVPHRASVRRTPAVRYDFERRSTGMSRDVRAW